MNTRLLLIAALMVGAFVAIAPTPAAGATDAQVRVIHASPDTPPVDVYVDGGKVLSALGFTKASDYLALAPGKHDIQFFAAGASPASSEPVIQAKGAEIPAGAKLSLVGIGWLASIRALVVDDRATPPAPGKAKLRFVHVGPDVQAIDVAARGGPVLFGDTRFGNAYPYQEIDARPADLEIRPVGTATAAVAVSFAPEAGKTYSAYLMSLGATKILLDTTASDATGTTGTTGSAGTNPILPATGGGLPQRVLDPGSLAAALAGVVSVGLGLALRRRAIR